jgi:uncharacterized membrane protein YjjP (DUF1212 family)
VFKKFAKKVAINIGFPILFFSVWFGSAVLLTLFGISEGAAVAVTAVVLIVIPGLVLALRSMYSDSKAEIEKENRELMRNLTDGYTIK